MQEELQKILTLNKTGKVSDDEAIQLIEEFNKSNKTEDFSEDNFKDFGLNLVKLNMKNNSKNMIEKVKMGSLGKIFASDLLDNNLNRSEVVSPKGNDYTFQNNVFKYADVKNFELSESEFNDNSINLASINEIKMIKSKIKDCFFKYSSVTKLKVDKSCLIETQLNYTEFDEISLTDESNVKLTDFDQSSINKIEIKDHTSWINSQISCAQIKELLIKNTFLEQFILYAVVFSDIKFEDSKLINFVMRGINWKDVSINNSIFKDVLFSGKGAINSILKVSQN